MQRRAALMVALVLLIAQLVAFADYFTDDSWIYARFASNLVAGDGLVFNPGEHIHAATSPAWALLVAALLGLGVPAVVGMKILGGLCAAGAILVAARLARRRFGDSSWAALLLLLFATEPWFVRWSASGMETPLAVLLLLVALEAGLRAPHRVAWSRLGWAVGMLPLVRPESLLLTGLVAAAVVLRSGTRGPIRFWVGIVLPLGAWISFALPYYGHWLPATLQAKSTPLGLEPDRLAHNISVLARLYGIALLLPAVAWVSGIFRRRPKEVADEHGNWLRPAWVLWSVALPVVYLVRDVQVVSRYLELVLPVVLLLGIDELSRWPRQKLLRAGIGLEVLAVLTFTCVRVMPSANAFGRSLSGLTEVGEWLKSGSAPDAVVAAYDIGTVGFASERYILDLGGLVNPGINDLRNAVDDARILHEGLFLKFGTPQFLVDRDPDGAVLDGEQLGGFRCEAVMGRTVENLGLTRPEPVVYTLYRMVRVDGR